MQNEYTGQTLTANDIEQNEGGSVFTNCTFQGDPIKEVNFAYAQFDGCTFNTSFERCNFAGIEGASKPEAAVLEFNDAPADGALVEIDGKPVGVGDGVNKEFVPQKIVPTSVKITEATTVVEKERTPGVITKEPAPGAVINAEPSDYTVSGDAVGCAFADLAQTRAQWIASLPSLIAISTDATDTADPIAGVPDIKADGVATCKVTVQKKDRAGADMVALGDDDDVEFETSRGKLSALKVAMKNGKAEVTLTSVAETCVATVLAKAAGMAPVAIQIQFAP